IAVAWLDQPLIMPRWPLFMLLAFGLARSTSVARARRLIDHLAPLQPESSEAEPSHPRRVTDRIRSFFAVRRARRAMQRERSEAIDAARLDEILQRLHEGGAHSLSSEDRMTLKRVSEALKKHRQT
ncbi:MAG: hypothetical protein ACF788_09505, partial [Novipirellula sp. JB048]